VSKLDAETYRQLHFHREIHDLYDTDALVEWLRSRGWIVERKDTDGTGRDMSHWWASNGHVDLKGIGGRSAIYDIAQEEGLHTDQLAILVIEHQGGPNWLDGQPEWHTEGDE